MWSWAYFFVHCRATRSCSGWLVVYWVAMLPTKGSAGLQSVNKLQKTKNTRGERRDLQKVVESYEYLQMESSTLEIVRAGDQLSFRMSRQITP